MKIIKEKLVKILEIGYDDSGSKEWEIRDAENNDRVMVGWNNPEVDIGFIMRVIFK